ncbi:traI domain protein [Escherichia coli P0304777.11]|nr:traI domain protein [Escherichia coli P0304777.11]
MSEHALRFQLTANGCVSMACSRTPLTCATLSSPAFTLAAKSPASRA